MALATRCPYCNTIFRVVEDQLKLRNGIVRCGSCQQVFNGAEQLLKPEDIDPTLAGVLAEQEEAAPVSERESATYDEAGEPTGEVADEMLADLPESDEAADSEALDDDAVLETPVLEEADAVDEEVADEDLNLILTPDSDFESRLEEEPEQEPVTLEEKDHLAWQSFELPAEVTAIDLDLGADIPEDVGAEEVVEPLEEEGEPELEAEPLALAAEIEVDHEEEAYAVSLSTSTAAPSDEREEEPELQEVEPAMTEAVEPDFMKRVRRQQQFGSVWRNAMLVGLLILPLFLLLQIGGAFHNRIVSAFPSAEPVLTKVCGIMSCRTALPRQIEKIAVEHSELLASDKNANRYALNLLLSNRSGAAQAWPNIELTLNDEGGNPVARRVFMPVDYLSNVNEKTQGVKAHSEKLVRLIFELDKLKAAGYLVHVFYL